MKKNYSLKIALAAVCLAPAVGNSQNLTDVLCNINADYASITALVPSMYTFAYDGTNNISDGGGDMYDGGNILNTDFQANIPYSDDLITASVAFGTTGQYFTRELPGLFTMVADLDNVTAFSLAGNNGADGGGSVDSHTFPLSYAGVNYTAYVKRVYAAGDPSINEVMIIEENLSAVHTFSTNTNDGAHALSTINATTRLYYFLVSSNAGGYIDNPTIESIANEYIAVAVGTEPVTISATATDICLGEAVTLSAITGTGPFTWDNGVTDGVPFTPSALGVTTYTVTGSTISGCNGQATIDINVKDVPAFTLMTSDEIAGNDGGVYVVLIDGIFPLTFDWDNDGTGDFDDAQNLTNVGNGTYQVVVMNANGCTDTASATVNSQVGIEDLDQNGIVTYPNPVNDNLNLLFSGEFVYQIVDMSGKVIMTGTATDQETIGVSQLTGGVYVVNIVSGSTVFTKEIVKL